MRRWISLTFPTSTPHDEVILFDQDVDAWTHSTISGLFYDDPHPEAAGGNYIDLAPVEPDDLKIHRIVRNGDWGLVWLWGEDQSRYIGVDARYREGRYRVRVVVHHLTVPQFYETMKT